MVKRIILDSYDLVPEAYRQRYRKLKKEEKQSYVEIASEQERLFQRWLNSTKTFDYDKLKQLMLLEGFKGSVTHEIRLYLEEKEADTLIRAATLSGNYALPHRNNTFRLQGTGGAVRPGVQSACTQDGGPGVARSKVENSGGTVKLGTEHNRTSDSGKSFKFGNNVACYYCKRTGHIAAQCLKLKAKQEKVPVTVNVMDKCDDTFVSDIVGKEVKSDLFEPFTFKGFVSPSDSCNTTHPILVLRDTRASHNIIVRWSIPFIEECLTGENVLLQGVGRTVNYLCASYTWKQVG